MHTDYHGYLDMPLDVVHDYMDVMEGEALAAKNPPRGNHASEVPGFTEETVAEVIEWKRHPSRQ